MEPYQYPSRRHHRRHGPAGYRQVRFYRPWLRDEFCFRCVYCLEREQWGNTSGKFHIDHFAAVVLAPERGLHYDNLLYTCHSCNALKGKRVIPDPLRVLLSDAVEVFQDGRMEARSQDAAKLIEIIGLDQPAYRDRRRVQIRLVALAKKHDLVLYRTLLGFPSELPNLSRLSPPSNSRPQGVGHSYYQQRTLGILPDTY